MSSPVSKHLRLGSLAAAAALALTAQAANVKPVTWEEIANDHKSTADVLTYGLGLTAQRYSPAKTLTTKNVAQRPGAGVELLLRRREAARPRGAGADP